MKPLNIMVPESAIEYFCRHVIQMVDPDACWQWQGSRLPAGYADIDVWLDGRYRHFLAHRVSFEIYHGHPPLNQVCHTCDNPPCTNPRHLYDGTQSRNILDCIGRNRHTSVKLTNDEVRQIRESRNRGERPVLIAERFRISRNYVYSLTNGWRRLQSPAIK